MMTFAAVMITAHSVFSTEYEEKMNEYHSAGLSKQKVEEINRRFCELPEQQQEEFRKEYARASTGMLFPGPIFLARENFLKKQAETVEVK